MNLKEIWLEFFQKGNPDGESWAIEIQKEYNNKIRDWIQIFFKKYGFIYLKDYVTITYLGGKWIQIEFYTDVKYAVMNEFIFATGLKKFKYLNTIDKDAKFRLELNL